MDANDPSGGQPPGWVPPPDPNQDPGGWSLQQGWGQPGGPGQPGPWGTPQPVWPPPGKRKRFGWGMVIGAFLIGGFLSAIVTVIALVAIGLAVQPHPIANSHPAVAEGADAVKVGDCLGDDPKTVIVVDQSDVVDCMDAHQAEVTAVLDAPGTKYRPVKDDLEAYVTGACELAFRGYVGSDPDRSHYKSKAVVPSSTAWSDGDRTVFCLVATPDVPAGAGSVKNSHR